MPSIYVPYTHVRESTYLYLLQSVEREDVVWVDCSISEWAYTDYLQQRWNARKAFINLEHDITPWPGAITSLMTCPNPWCFFGYTPQLDLVANGAAPFGMVKFTPAIMDAVPRVWEHMRDRYRGDERAWSFNDIFFFEYATAAGCNPHQHFPSVLNAQPPNPHRVNMETILQCPSPARSTST